MLLNDTAANGEAQAGSFSFRLGSEKRVPNLFQVRRFNAGAGIDDLDSHPTLLLAGTSVSDGQSSATLHRVRCVCQQINEDLAQLLSISLNHRQSFVMIDHDLDLVAAHVVLDQFERFVDLLADVNRRGLSMRAAAE